MSDLVYFTEKEINEASFGCDDGYERMSIKALLRFDRLRANVGFPLKPTCAFRTREWDLAKKRSGDSRHISGIAMDFACTDPAKRGKIIEEAIKMGFKGIGIHEEFIHVDDRGGDVLKVWPY